MVCEKCGKEFFEDWRKDLKTIRKNPIPRFCSRSCANSKTRTKEIKEKISKSIKLSEKAKIARNNIKRKPAIRISKICPVCGRTFETSKSENKTFCSLSCWRKYSGGLRNGSGRSKSGYYKGIYCSSTYELCWVIYNLDHNIFFKRSNLKIPYFYEGKEHIYYPDFEIEDGTIVEIKGYHTDLVDAKTDAVIKQGYKIIVLYKANLQNVFDYVKNKYNTSDFAKLYDSSKQKFIYTCDFCGKEFIRTKKIKSSTKFCSRKCCGKYMAKMKHGAIV